MCVRYGFVRYARQRRGYFGIRFCEGWSSLLRAVRQTDRFGISAAETLGKPREFDMCVPEWDLNPCDLCNIHRVESL